MAASGMNRSISRRRCLAAMGLWAAAWSGANADRPPVTNPRATDGDDRYEPDWKERLTIKVGQDKRADLMGKDDKVLQAAVDYVARRGGGTVHVLPGKYTLRNSVQLASRVRILGSGQDAVITKIASETIPLSEDSDWYDREVTLSKAGGFRVGDGVVLRAKNPHNGGSENIKRMLVARSGNRFRLDQGLRKNLWLSGKPTISSLFPLLSGDRVHDVVIENLTLDGNRPNNENFNGNYGGCIFMQDCNRWTISKVVARNYNGDGISFQICHDIVVEHCHSFGHQDLGVHPGSGSQRPLIRHNRMENNGLGLFWCWGVKFGLAEHNKMIGNRNYGISIGHNDCDNVMRDNDVIDSGKVGVLFRNDTRGKDFWANRNVLENNRIINSGGEEGVAIDIQGRTKDIRIIGNTIQEKRAPMKRIGIRIAKEAKRILHRDNDIKGFAFDVVDGRADT